jgi:hypothetical protein
MKSPFTDLQELQEAQLIRIEEGWREKLRESQAQILALREALVGCASRLQIELCRQNGEVIPDSAKNAPSALQNILNIAKAMSPSPPPVVPLEDVRPLLDALKIITANPGASHGPCCLYDSGPIAARVIAKFTTQHPLP